MITVPRRRGQRTCATLVVLAMASVPAWPQGAAPAPAAPAPAAPAAAARAAETLLLQQLRPAIAKCWSVDAATLAASKRTVQIEFDLKRNGTLVGAPRIVTRRGEPTPVALAQSATRAIQACAPFANLPVDAFDAGTRRIRMNFDARAMTP